MSKISVSNTVAPILMTLFATAAIAEEGHSGWFFSVGGETASDRVANSYELLISKSLYGFFVDNDAIRTALPNTVSLGIQESNCLNAELGYRFSGGNSGVGSLSYSWSAYAAGSLCDARIHFDAREIKQIARDVVRDTVHNGTTTVLQDLRYNYGGYLAPTGLTITDGHIDEAATYTTDYVMDTSAPLPSNDQIATAFSTLSPAIPVGYTGIADSFEGYATDVLGYATQARQALNMINSVPDTLETSGKIATLSFGTSLDLKYRMTNTFNVFGGIDARAIAKASIAPSPVPGLYNDDMIIGFVGFEVDATIGAEIEDVIGTGNLWASYTKPVYRDYTIPTIDGVGIISGDQSYYNAGLRFDNGFGLHAKTPTDRSIANDNTQIGITHQFDNGLSLNVIATTNGKAGGAYLSMSF